MNDQDMSVRRLFGDIVTRWYVGDYGKGLEKVREVYELDAFYAPALKVGRVRLRKWDTHEDTSTDFKEQWTSPMEYENELIASTTMLPLINLTELSMNGFVNEADADAEKSRQKPTTM